MKIAKESIGWYIAGITGIITGAVLYPTTHSGGAFYIELGAITLVLGAMAVRIKVTYIKVFLKSRAKELLKEYQ